MVVVVTSLCAAGVSAATASLVYGAVKMLPGYQLAMRLKSVAPKKEKRKRTKPTEKNNDVFIVGSIAAFFAASLTAPEMWAIAVPFGFLSGAGFALLARGIYRKAQYMQKLREAALVYEAVDLYTRVGYTVRQSLELSVPLTRKLRPVLEKCLDRWSAGAGRALEQLGQDMNISEADVLISLLMLAEQSGTQRISGVMEEESVKLEELRRTLAEIQLAGRPVYMTAYLFLPLAGFMGLFMGPMAWRVINMVAGMKAGGP